MSEVVLYPPIEPLVITYLRTRLERWSDPVTVATRVPVPRPDRLVRITAAGGGETNVVLSTRLVIVECWDTREPEAALLAERCWALLLASRTDPGEPRIRNAVNVGAPVNHPDPDTRHPRYQFTVALTLRGLPDRYH